jgi:hypothetical protein
MDRDHDGRDPGSKSCLTAIWRKLLNPLIVACADWDYNLDHHFAC